MDDVLLVFDFMTLLEAIRLDWDKKNLLPKKEEITVSDEGETRTRMPEGTRT
jgi:hypothetical protein